MAELIKEIVVWPLGVKSQRGYVFREGPVRDFLDSATWSKRKKDRTALCSVTHYTRRKPKNDNDAKAVGARDYQLLDQTTVGTIIDMWIDNGVWKAKMLIFDPDKFAGSDAYKDIVYVQGLINSGVKLPISCGCEAYYSPTTHEAEKIYDFVGVDFTLSPDQQAAGIVVKYFELCLEKFYGSP